MVNFLLNSFPKGYALPLKFPGRVRDIKWELAGFVAIIGGPRLLLLRARERSNFYVKARPRCRIIAKV